MSGMEKKYRTVSDGDMEGFMVITYLTSGVYFSNSYINKYAEYFKFFYNFYIS